MTEPHARSLLMVTTVPVTLSGFLLPIAQRMREDGWRVDAAANGICEERECASAFDRVWDIDWSRNPLKPSNLSRALRQVRAAVDEGEHDVVHVHTPVAAFITRWALRRKRARGEVKVIYTAHGFHFHERNTKVKNAAFIGLEKAAGRWTDRLVLINRNDVEQALAHHVVEPEHVVYMHGIGIDTNRYRPGSLSKWERDAVRERVGVRPDETLLLMPAEFTPNKRQARVVDALAFTMRSDIHVAFAGTGRTFDDVKSRARDLGVSDNTHFLGWRQDVSELMAAADGVVLFSEREGLSRSVMEALAMERPVIGSDIRGIRDLLSDGCGILVDPERVDQLAQAFVRLEADPVYGEQMGRAGRMKIMGEYEESLIVGQHEQLYEEVLAHG